MLTTAEGEELRRAARVASDTLLRVAAADVATADAATGINVATAHETVALRLGMSAKTVQRARLLLERLGLAITLVGGRYLTAAERSAARAAYGGHQVRAASTRALLMPALTATAGRGSRRAVKNVLLPDSRREYRSVTSQKSTPTRVNAREAAAARRLELRRRAPFATSQEPRPLALQQIAGRLAARMPWLARGVHIGRLCDVLARSGVDPRRWDATSLMTEVDRFLAEHRVQVAGVGQQRDPLAYLGWMLRRAVANVTETPLERLQRERLMRLQERQQRAAEDAASRARSATMSDEDFYRIKAEMEAQLRVARAARVPAA